MKTKNENVLTYDKDKFKKRFTTFYKITNVMEKIALVLTILAIIVVTLSLILFTTKTIDQEFLCTTFDLKDINFFSTENIVDILEIEDEEDINALKELETEQPELFSTLFKVLFVAYWLFEFTKMFVIVFILKKLKTLFKNTADNLTPFTEENVKCMNTLFTALIVYWLLTASTGLFTSLIYIISIIAINYMFKCGYELQKESDELL